MNKDRWILLGLIGLVALLVASVSWFLVPWTGRRFAHWASGKLSDALGTEASFRSLGLTRSGRIVVRDLLIVDPLGGEETFFYSPRVEVTIDPLRLLEDGVNLSRVDILRPYVSIYRGEDGQWNVRNFRKKKPEGTDGKPDGEEPGGPEAGGEEGEKEPFRLRIHEVVLEGCVTRLRGVLGEEIVTVLDHRGALELTAKRQEIYLYDTRFNTTYLTLNDMTASGKLVYENQALSFENFHLLRDGTDLRAEGAIDFEGEDTIDLRVERGHYVLDQIPPRYGLRHKVSGEVELELRLEGPVRSPEITGTIYDADGVMFEYPFRDVRGDFHLNEGVVDITGLSAGFLTGRIEGDVSFFLRERPRAFRTDLTIEGLDVTALPLDIPESFATDLNGSVVAYGAGFSAEEHSSTILLDLGESRFRGRPLRAAQAQVLAGGDGIHVVSSTIRIGGGTVALTGDLGGVPDVEVTTEGVAIPALVGLLDLPYELDGEIFASLSIADGYARPSVRGQAVIRNGEAWGWKFAGLEGDLDIRQRDGRVEGSADLKAFMIGRGELQAEEARVDARFGPDGIRLASLGLRRGDSTFVDGRATLLYAGEGLRVRTDSLRLRHRDIEVVVDELRGGVAWREDVGVVDVDTLRLKVAGGEVALAGSLRWPERIDVTADVRSVRLEALRALFPDGVDAEGILDLRLDLQGPLERPEATLDARIEGPAYEGVPADSLVVRAHIADGRLGIERLVLRGGGNDVSIAGSVPVRFGLAPACFEGMKAGPIDLEGELGRVDLRTLGLLTDEVEFSSGGASGRVGLAGTLGDPRWSGVGAMEGGEGVVSRTNTLFTDLVARFSFEDRALSIDSLGAALMGGGSLHGRGKLVLDGFLPTEMNLDLAARDYAVNQVRYVTSLLFDGDLHIAGPVSGPDVTGRVMIRRGVVDIPVGDGAANGETEGDIPFGLDLDVRAENDLWIRNAQTNVEISLDMKLVTQDRRILPVGDLEIIRGSYTYYGSVFDIDEGEIHFSGQYPINPTLDVITSRTIRGRVGAGETRERVSNTFRLTVFGTYRDVQFDIVVTDTNGDILPIDRQRALTLLLANMTNEEFDERASPGRQQFMSQIEGILAQQTNSLIQPISSLDLFEVRTNFLAGDAGDARAQVTIGEYLMEDVFVSYSQDILDPSINNILVEFFLGRKSSLVGQTDSRGRQYSVELKYRFDY